MPVEPVKSKRLYQEVADQITTLISSGELTLGERLPPERQLATNFNVSRATIREAMIALEIGGIVEIKTGAGIYVLSDLKGNVKAGLADIGPGPFELIEARMIFEGEAAALAAVRISEEEIRELDKKCKEMASLIAQGESAEVPDRTFHQIIAAATRNSTILSTIEQMWAFRTRMPMWQKLHDVISEIEDSPDWNNDRQTINDHRNILAALRARNPDAARLAMQSHLKHVNSALLKASEIESIEISDAGDFIKSQSPLQTSTKKNTKK